MDLRRASEQRQAELRRRTEAAAAEVRHARYVAAKTRARQAAEASTRQRKINMRVQSARDRREAREATRSERAGSMYARITAYAGASFSPSRRGAERTKGSPEGGDERDAHEFSPGLDALPASSSALREVAALPSLDAEEDPYAAAHAEAAAQRPHELGARRRRQAGEAGSASPPHRGGLRRGSSAPASEHAGAEAPDIWAAAPSPPRPRRRAQPSLQVSPLGGPRRASRADHAAVDADVSLGREAALPGPAQTQSQAQEREQGRPGLERTSSADALLRNAARGDASAVLDVDSEGEGEDEVEEREAAASTLQAWWRAQCVLRRTMGRIRGGVDAFQQLVQHMEAVRGAPMHTVAAKLGDESVQALARSVLASVPKDRGVRRRPRLARTTRAFLATLPMLHHAPEVFGGEGEVPSQLVRAAETQWRAAHLLFEAAARVRERPFAGNQGLRRRVALFNAMRCAYMDAFLVWRARDAERILESALPTYVRLLVAQDELERSDASSDQIRASMLADVQRQQQQLVQQVKRVAGPDEVRDWVARAAAEVRRAGEVGNQSSSSSATSSSATTTSTSTSAAPAPMSPPRAGEDARGGQGAEASTRTSPTSASAGPVTSEAAAVAARAVQEVDESGEAAAAAAAQAEEATASPSQANAPRAAALVSENEALAHELMVNDRFSLVRGLLARRARERLQQRQQDGEGAATGGTSTTPLPSMRTGRGGTGSGAGGEADPVEGLADAMEAGEADSEDELVAGQEEAALGPTGTRVRDAMRRAFWDRLMAQVEVEEGGEKDWSGVVSVLGELRDAIKGIVPRNERFAAEVEEAAGDAVLGRVFSHGAVDGSALLALFNALVGKVQELEAPAETVRTRQWASEVADQLRDALAAGGSEGEGAPAPAPALRLLPTVVEGLFARVELIRAGAADFRFGLAREQLRQHGPGYERQRFADRLREGRVTLGNTAQWIMETASVLRHYDSLRRDGDGDGGGGSGGPQVGGDALPRVTEEEARTGGDRAYRAFLAEGLVALVMRSQAITADNAPETLLLDTARLSRVQNDLQLVALAATLSLLLRQTLGPQASQAQAARLQAFDRRTARLLRHPGTRLPHVTEACAVEAREVSRLEGLDLPESAVLLLQSAVRSAASLEHRVLKLLRQRAAQALRMVLMGDGVDAVHAYARRAGLGQFAAKLGRMGTRLHRVLAHNLAVYAPYYNRIIPRVLAPQSAGSAQA